MEDFAHLVVVAARRPEISPPPSYVYASIAAVVVFAALCRMSPSLVYGDAHGVEMTEVHLVVDVAASRDLSLIRVALLDVVPVTVLEVAEVDD